MGGGTLEPPSNVISRLTRWDTVTGTQRKCFNGNAGDTSERRRGAHMGFSERIDLYHLKVNGNQRHAAMRVIVVNLITK